VVGSSWQTFSDGTSTGTTTTVTGLTNGTAYRFRVAAVTGFGTGAYSTESAVVTPLTVASAVTNLTPTPGDRRVTLNWTAPVDNGGSAVTDYVVQYRTQLTPQPEWTTFTDAVSSSTQAIVTGLENGVVYRFRVAAVTAAGTSTNWLRISDVTPATVPSAPGGLVVEPSDGRVALAWSTPNNGGSQIADYIVQYRTNTAGSQWQTFADGVSVEASTIVTGLTNATSYVFRVAAINAMGQGQPSAEAIAMPGPQAPAPTRLTGRAGDSSVSLVWTAPTIARGQQIVDYAIDFRLMTGDVGGPWQRANDSVSTSTQATVTGLLNGQTYEFRVAAITTPGNVVGVFSAVSARQTPQALPPAPSSLTAKKQTSTSVALSWTPPLAMARATTAVVTGYVVQYREATSSRWVTREISGSSTSSVISQLSSRKSYVFRVAARSSAGLGAFTSEVRA